MNQRVLSRSQRRMERKQAIILLCLALAISLVSFSLGVMVGRSGNRPEPVASSPAPVALPRPAPMSPPEPPAEPVVQREANPPAADAPAVEAPAPGSQPDPGLTFYETLPQGGQPLGSGINLPPATAEPKAPASEPAVAAPAPAVKSAPVPAVPTAPGGEFVVQIASFKDAAAAEVMLKKLSGKGYVLFVEPVDLGAKGTWYRVYAGPYSGREAADRVAGQLHDREKISPLVRKR